MLPEETRALARNDRYLLEFVEKLNLCPYARRCRETGALERRVILGKHPNVDATLDVLIELSADTFRHIEVALLIFPEIDETFQSFERFAATLRDTYVSKSTRETYFIIPFHPESPPDADTPNRLVSLLRRSPDPTLQLVRASILEGVRGGVDPEDTVYLPPSAFAHDAPLPAPPKSVSHIISETNFETAQKMGAEALVSLLSNLRAKP